MAHLVIKSGAGQGETQDKAHPLTKEVMSIGRGLDNDIRLEHGSVSRRHALIIRSENGRYRIRDRGSTYGTYVDDRKTEESELKDGARIRLGKVLLEFVAAEELRQALPDPDSEPDSGGLDTGDFTILHSLGARGETEDVGDLRAAKERLQTALEVSTLLRSTENLSQLFEKILEQTLKVVHARQAGIILWDADRAVLEPVTGTDAKKTDSPWTFSRTIVMRVIETGESLLTADATAGDELETSASMLDLGIKSAMCVPLRHEDAILGALNVDSTGRGAFHREDLRLLNILGNIAGSAIVNSRLQEENLRAARMAAIGESMAGLAHDIKNIMAGIRGGAFMVDQALEAGEQEMLKPGWELVKVSQDRINQLVLNMLDYSKERRPQFEDVDLEETLGNVRELIAFRGKDQGVEVLLQVHPEVRTIRAEGLSIHRCVLNLAGNALDALSEDRPGKITIRCRREDAGAAIDVEDNGVGIPEGKIAEIFKAFSSTKGARGTGLGLAVSRKIAKEHGGDITVRSQPGAGTTFTIHLPGKEEGNQPG